MELPQGVPEWETPRWNSRCICVEHVPRAMAGYWVYITIRKKRTGNRGKNQCSCNREANARQSKRGREMESLTFPANRPENIRFRRFAYTAPTYIPHACFRLRVRGQLCRGSVCALSAVIYPSAIVHCQGNTFLRGAYFLFTLGAIYTGQTLRRKITGISLDSISRDRILSFSIAIGGLMWLHAAKLDKRAFKVELMMPIGNFVSILICKSENVERKTLEAVSPTSRSEVWIIRKHFAIRRYFYTHGNT